MPTMAKLTAALLLGAVAWFVSGMVKGLLPEGTPTPMMAEFNAIIGAYMGWLIIGSRAGNGFVAAFGIAITAILGAIFWCIFLWAGYEMIKLSTRLRYDGPMEAITDFFQIGIEYGALLADPEILGTLGIAAVVLAIIPELVSKVWR